MAARKPEPTGPERQYLNTLLEMQKERVPFSFPEMKARLGKAISSLWQTHGQLIAKGLVDPEGAWLAVMRGPRPTKKALKYLKAA